jgi:hypothetical protein
MLSKDEDRIDEFIKYIELEKSIINTLKNSELEHLDNNLCKLGFVKIFESECTKWFVYEDNKYILVLEDNQLNLYEKAIELHFNKE